MKILIISIIVNSFITYIWVNLLIKKHFDQIDEEFETNYKNIYEGVFQLIKDRQKQTNNQK